MGSFPSGRLLGWYDKNRRDLPWRKTGDPYRIWVSEVMLQQTRVDSVIPYYHRFLEAFPSVESLAAAERQQLLKIWEGLGYYSRARNLQDAARIVAGEHGGELPDDEASLRELPGIGPYTAAALLSIAFGKPYAVVDGNVIRVLTRYFGIRDDIRSNRTRKEIEKLASQILDEERPGDFNQAVMELGATICKPSSPDCSRCPISARCAARLSAETDSIPWKSPRGKIPHHDIGVGLIRNSEDKLLIALRPEEAMLGGLWEFPGGKRANGEEIRQTVRREIREETGLQVEVGEPFKVLDHAYSHFKITLHAYWCRPDPPDQTPVAEASRKLRWVGVEELEEYPFPKANKTLTEALRKSH